MLELVLGDRTRVPLVDDVTIGRAPGNTIQLEDRAVSRRQARIVVSAEDGTAVVEDAGSSYGTWLDGHRLDGQEPLKDGSRIRIGNHELIVERRRADDEAGRTIVVERGATTPGGRLGDRPQPRPGYALQRLEASEGRRRRGA